MQQEQKRKGDGTTFDVIDKLAQARDAVAGQLAQIGDDPGLVSRCEAKLAVFSELFGNVRRLAPQVEQLKGLSKGLALAGPMVNQHIEILKQRFSDPGEGDKLKFGRDIVVGCVGSLTDAATKQREELLRTTGKFDGAVMSALGIVRQVEDSITHYRALKEAEAELDNPFPEGEAPSKPNGGRQKKKAPARRKKKTTAKKAKAELAN